MIRRLPVLLMLAALPLTAVDRQIQELQRDVAQLQDLVKSLQTTVNEKLASLETQVQSSAQAASQANAAVTAVQRSLDQAMKEQQNKLVPPMAAMGTRLDQLSGGMGAMQQAVTDLAAMMSRLQTQIGDLNNAVKVLSAPPAAPPPTAEKPPLPAGDMFDNADRDRRSGKLDLAAQEYTDYLKWYGDTPLASDAQYYVGSIHLSQDDLERAVKDFNTVLSTYPDARKTPDALFYKGKALMLLGRTAEANDTFKDLRKRYPTHDLAKQSLTIRPASNR